MFVAKDEAGKICFMDFQHAKKTLVPHTFLNNSSIINNQPPLQLSHIYDSLSDLLCVDLISENYASKLDIVNLYDPTITIIFDVDNLTKRICGFIIMGASRCVAKSTH